MTHDHIFFYNVIGKSLGWS